MELLLGIALALVALNAQRVGILPSRLPMVTL